MREKDQLSTTASTSQVSESQCHDDDVFSSLLGDKVDIRDKQLSSRDSYIVNGEDVSATIATCSISDWVIQSASMYKNTLLLLAKEKGSQDDILQVLRSRLSISFGDVKIPSFLTSPVLLRYCLSSQELPARAAKPHSLPSRVLSYRSALRIVTCGLRQGSESVCLLQDGLYAQLFGPECKLSNSPILLLGCQNGHIYYCDLNRLEHSGGGEKSPLIPLYSLDQPVVAIHAAGMPQEADKQDPLLLSNTSRNTNATSNVLFFVGQKGKVVVCRPGRATQKVVNMFEFHVPGPIISSLLIQDQCLLYSTLRGAYEICLKPDCIQKSIPSVDRSSPVLIPEMAFMFPNRVSHSTAFILGELSASAAATEPRLYSSVICMSPRGHVSSLNVSDEGETRSSPSAAMVAQDLKQSLTAIQATAKQITATKENLASLNGSLSELNDALSLLCDVARSNSLSDSEESPFCCTLWPAFEDVGVSSRRAFIHVKLSYTGSKPLGRGWSFAVQLHPTEMTDFIPNCVQQKAAVVTSYISPLTNLTAGGCLEMKVDIDLSSTDPLVCSLYCFLHYSTENIPSVKGLDSAGNSGASLPLCRKRFDALDFLQPLHSSPKDLVPTRGDSSYLDTVLTPSRTTALPVSQHFLLHSLEIAIPQGVMCGLRDSASGSESMQASSLCASFLKKLVSGNTVRMVEESSVEVRVTAHDGSPVCLQVVSQDDSFNLVIQTALRKLLTQIVHDVECRVRQWAEVPLVDVEGVSHDQLCKKLSSLQVW